MSTTSTLDKRARRRAAHETRPLKDMINDALRAGLARGREVASRNPFH